MPKTIEGQISCRWSAAKAWMRGVMCSLLALCMLAPMAVGQSLAGLGALRGTVLDASGSAVPKASVVVANPAIGLTRELIASSDGGFEASSLPPNDGYTVTVTMPGFATYVAKNISVHVGEVVTIPVALTVSQVAETVSVDASVSELDTTRSGVSELVGQQAINELPINGRRVDQFVLLTPGVTTDGAGGEVTFRGVPGNNIFLQDGMDVTQQWGQDDAGSTSAFSPLSQDAVQEFQVQTSGYTAEFGHAAGGIVNTLTKSGSNSFHGSAFEFFKNRTLNATDPYSFGLNGQLFNPPNWRHQFGGSVGGPIIKDKLFFFANTEITRESRPLVSSTTGAELNSVGAFNNNNNKETGCDTNPTNDPKDTDFATPAQCAAAQAYIQKTFATLPRKLNENIGFLKLDYRPTEKDSVSANFNLMQFASPNGTVSASALSDGSGYYPNGNQIDLTRWTRFSETHVVSPSAINEFRFGWFKDTRKQSLNAALAPAGGLASGLTAGDLSNLGESVNIPNSQPSEDRFLFVDSYSKTYQKHQIKVGAETNYMRDVEDALFYARGQFFYGTVTDWAQDLTPSPTDPNAGQHYYGFLQGFGPLLTRAIVRDYNFYGQDQYKVNSKLTLDLGLRYEFNRFTQPPENPDYPQTGRLNQPKDNFAPRLGFAYSMNNGATVVRGGYGISYARLPSASVIRLQQRNGVIQQTIFFVPGEPGAPKFPNYDLSSSATSQTNVTYADPNLKTPYTEQADLTVEQRLDAKTTLSASYLWNTGQDFLTRVDDNLVAPTQTYTYEILDASGHQTGTYTTPIYTATHNPKYAVLNHIYNGGKLYYDGLAVTLSRRQSKYTTLDLAYTWSHAIDLGLGNGADNIYYTDPPLSVLNGDPRDEKGRSPLDQRHRLVFSGLIALPQRGYGSTLLDQSLNGWQLSGIETYASQQGVDPYYEVTQLPSGAFTEPNGNNTLSGDGIGFASYQRVPFQPRSGLPLGTTIRTDARLTKAFKLPREQSLTLNFEGFNVFNYITITSVREVTYNAITLDSANKIGALQAVPGAGTGNASQGFPDGTNARRGQVSVRYTF